MVISDPVYDVIKLLPGEIYFGNGNTQIVTLLGSCVTITVWHPLKKLGGMCHYLLPERGDSDKQVHGYYADDAVDYFVNKIHMTGAKPSDYEVKLFGGGNMFSGMGYDDRGFDVPGRNISTGKQLLKSNGFIIMSSDLGGPYYRNIRMNLWNGDVWVKRTLVSGDDE